MRSVDQQTNFVERYGPWSVVLGASEGLGAAYAHGLAARGMNVVVAARRTDVLQRVAGEVAADHGVETRAVPLDLASPDLLARLQAASDDLDVGLVVYNGASGYVGPMRNQDTDSLRSIVAVNCAGPLQVCHYFGVRMI